MATKAFQFHSPCWTMHVHVIAPEFRFHPEMLLILAAQTHMYLLKVVLIGRKASSLVIMTQEAGARGCQTSDILRQKSSGLRRKSTGK